MAGISCRDKDGVLITCSEDWWNKHIEAEHSEMKGCESYVQATIQNPYQVYQDARHIDRRILYKPFILPHPFDKYYLRVVIKYEQKKPPSNARGYVLTAFPSTKRKGDILIWQNSSL